MNALRKTLLCLCIAASCLLAFGQSSQALAEPIDFSFRQGPSTMVIPVNDYRQFHSNLTNTGDTADSYTLNLTMEEPANWVFNVCYDDVCYPEINTTFTVPAVGMVDPGGTVDFDFDVTSLMDEGPASYTIEILSNTDGSVVGTWTFDVVTPSEGYDMVFSPGEGVTHMEVNEFYQFLPVLYNAGSMADTYTLTAVRNQPENWSTTYCFDGICYPPTNITQQIPMNGTMAPGADMHLEIDFTTLFDEGTGSITIGIRSNTDPSLYSTATFTATTGSVVGVEEVPATVLSDLRAAPNPFNPKTDIRFTVGGTAAQNAVIDIFDASGRRVRTLVSGDLNPGPQSVAWDGRSDSGESLSAGVYLASVNVGAVQQTIKMSLVK